MSDLLLVLILTVPLAIFLWRTRYRHLGPCPRCRERGGRARWSTDEAYSRCRTCGGSRERIRPMARIWPKHRAEARRRKP